MNIMDNRSLEYSAEEAFPEMQKSTRRKGSLQSEKLSDEVYD